VILTADIEFILMLAKEGLFNNIIICGRDDKKFKEMGTNETQSGKGKNKEITASLNMEYFRNKGNILGQILFLKFIVLLGSRVV
jgi:hypothetical protein